MSNDATLDEFAESASEKSSEDNWHTHSLGDLAEYQNGNAFSKSEWANNGYPIIRIQNLTGEQDEFNYYNGDLEERYKVQSGDTLLSWSATIDVFQWRGSDAALNQHIFRVDTSESVNDTFYRFKLESLLPQLEALSHGSTMKHVRKADLVNLDTEIPPLSEQRKIATVLHTVDQAIQRTEDIIEQSKKLKRGIKQDLLSEGYHHHETEQRRIGAKLRKIPSEWETAELGELAEYQNGYGFSKEQWSDTGRLIIRIQDLTTPEESDMNYFDGEIDSKYEVENGDILVSWSATLGVFRWNRGDAVLNQHIFKVRNIEDIVSEQFLYHILDDSLTELERKLHGSTMKHVTRSAFEGTEVPLPPKNEQIQIAKTLDDIDQQIQSQKKYRSKLQKVKDGLMQDLLSGEVRTTDVDIDIPEEVAKYG